MQKESEHCNPGVIVRNVVPVKSEPDTDSDQLTQAIIGETVEHDDCADEWVKITLRDRVSGWVKADSVTKRDGSAQKCASAQAVIVHELIVDARKEPFPDAPIVTKLTYGAVLESCKEAGGWVELSLPDGSFCFVPCGSVADYSALIYDPLAVVLDAVRFVGIPYLWGGKSPFGVDCSGFIQLLHQSHSLLLPRNSRQQSECDTLEDVPLDKIRAGDLLFFASGRNTVDHVGMAIGNAMFTHSCSARGVCTMELSNSRYADILVSARRAPTEST